MCARWKVSIAISKTRARRCPSTWRQRPAARWWRGQSSKEKRWATDTSRRFQGRRSFGAAKNLIGEPRVWAQWRKCFFEAVLAVARRGGFEKTANSKAKGCRPEAQHMEYGPSKRARTPAWGLSAMGGAVACGAGGPLNHSSRQGRAIKEQHALAQKSGNSLIAMSTVGIVKSGKAVDVSRVDVADRQKAFDSGGFAVESGHHQGRAATVVRNARVGAGAKKFLDHCGIVLRRKVKGGPAQVVLCVGICEAQQKVGRRVSFLANEIHQNSRPFPGRNPSVGIGPRVKQSSGAIQLFVAQGKRQRGEPRAWMDVLQRRHGREEPHRFKHPLLNGQIQRGLPQSVGFCGNSLRQQGANRFGVALQNGGRKKKRGIRENGHGF